MIVSLGVELDGPTWMLGDDILVILNTTVPSIILKEKQDAIPNRWARETIAARIMGFAYTKNEENVSDVLTKPLINEELHY
jgi:hypothetical protein